MNDTYKSPEIIDMDLTASAILCQSLTVPAGSIEDADRLEFDW